MHVLFRRWVVSVPLYWAINLHPFRLNGIMYLFCRQPVSHFHPPHHIPSTSSLFIKRGEWMIDQSILQLMSLQFHSSPSQIPIVNSSVRISLHSAEWKTNGNPVISMDTVQGSKSQLSISSVSFHYSRDLFEETVHSLLSLLIRLPSSLRLQWAYSLLAESRHWAQTPLTSTSFPPFLTSLQSENNTFTMHVNRCSLLLLDSSHSFLIQSALQVDCSPSAFGIILSRPTVHSEQDLILKVDQASFIGHCASGQRYLDLAFSRVRVSLSLDCISRLFQVVRSVTFSIWCCLFDMISVLHTGAISSARLLNDHFQDVSARNGRLQPPFTLRSRPYSDRSEYLRLRNCFQQTLSSEGDMIQRLQVIDTELRLNCNHQSIGVRVNRWGADSLPSIDFYAKAITITSSGCVIRLSNCSFKECLHSKSLRAMWNKRLPRSKTVFGVLAWEVILRGRQCGELMECSCSCCFSHRQSVSTTGGGASFYLHFRYPVPFPSLQSQARHRSDEGIVLLSRMFPSFIPSVLQLLLLDAAKALHAVSSARSLPGVAAHEAGAHHGESVFSLL